MRREKKAFSQQIKLPRSGTLTSHCWRLLKAKNKQAHRAPYGGEQNDCLPGQRETRTAMQEKISCGSWRKKFLIPQPGKSFLARWENWICLTECLTWPPASTIPVPP